MHFIVKGLLGRAVVTSIWFLFCRQQRRRVHKRPLKNRTTKIPKTKKNYNKTKIVNKKLKKITFAFVQYLILFLGFTRFDRVLIFFCMNIFFLPFSFGCCWFVCFFRNVNESMYSISYLVIKSKLYNFIEFLIFFLFLFVLILSSMAEFVSVNACVNEWMSEWLHLPRTLLIIQNQRIKIWIHFKSDEYYGNPRDQHIRSANDWCDMHNKRYFPSHTYQPLRARPIKFQPFSLWLTV